MEYVRAADVFDFKQQEFFRWFLRGGCNLFEINFMRGTLSSNDDDDDEGVFPKIVSLVLFCGDEALRRGSKTTHDD